MVALESAPIPTPIKGDVLVFARVSLVNSDTELRKKQDEKRKKTQNTNHTNGKHPDHRLPYGFSLVGEILDVSDKDDKPLIGERVFAHQRHETHFTSPLDDLIPIPDAIKNDDAIFFATMEAAFHLVQAARPMPGERFVVIGNGAVAKLAVELLRATPLETLVSVEKDPDNNILRFYEHTGDELREIRDEKALQTWLYRGRHVGGADAVLHVASVPGSAVIASAAIGASGRMIIRSCSHEKSDPMITMNEELAAKEVSIFTSRTDQILPELRGRWSSERRHGTVWNLIHKHRPSKWISETIRLHDIRALYPHLKHHEGMIKLMY